nr:hypothetical protein BaRGS_022612 [Batillaria attramentaria]
MIPESEAEAEGGAPESEAGDNMAAEPESHAEAEAEAAGAEPEPQSEPEAWPEAGPDWPSAKTLWQSAWPFHVYFFSFAFIVISLVALYTVVTALWHKHRRSSAMGRTAIALNVMVFSFAITRAVFLLADPYFSEEVVPFIAARLVWSFGIPGFTASFSIMLLILLDTTKMSLGPPRFQRLGTVVVIWVLHMLIVLITDLLVFYVEADVRPLLVMCQMLFVVYGALLALGYVYVGVKMKGNLKASADSYQPDDQAARLQFLVRTTFLSAAVSLSVAVLNLYTIASDFGPYAGVAFVDAWSYWIVQTISRGDDSKESNRNWCWCWKKRKSIMPQKVAEVATSRGSAVTGIKWVQHSELPSVERD